MPAYVISRVTPVPGDALDQYRALAEASIAKYGGRYLVRGGPQEVLEGAWGKAAIIVEFPSVEAARQWYASLDYGEALEVRDDALTRDLVLVSGDEQPLADNRL